MTTCLPVAWSDVYIQNTGFTALINFKLENNPMFLTAKICGGNTLPKIALVLADHLGLLLFLASKDRLVNE